MKSILLIVGVLALTIFPVQAGAHISVSLGGGGGGGFHGTFSTGGYHCGYAASCYTPYRACNYATYPYANRYCYPYYNNYGYNYGYNYVGYSPYSYYPSDYNIVSYSPAPPSYIPPQVPPPEPTPAPQAQTFAPIPTPAATPAPAPAQLDFGILDVNGFVHSPYSDAIFKVPGVRNAQMVYDPVTGKPFLVR